MGGDEINIKSLQASHIKILTQRIYMKVYVLGRWDLTRCLKG
jgi:hypothetical protein